MKKEKNITAKTILKNLKIARSYKQKWIEEANEDYEFLLSKQWEDDAKDKLEKAGVRALTINKIQPQFRLVTGVERQNRTDFFAYPEGEEDSLTGEIITRLLKNIMKKTEGEYKLSEMFEDGLTCGEGYIEPWIDYTYDLLNGDMKLKKQSPLETFIDPTSKEYDLCDAEYVIKIHTDLNKDQVISLFPEKEKDIENIKEGKVNIDLISRKEKGDRYKNAEIRGNDSWDTRDEQLYDLVCYYYKKYIKKYMIVDKTLGEIKEMPNKEAAEEYRDAAIAENVRQAELRAQTELEVQQNPSVDESGQPIPDEPQPQMDIKDVIVIERVIPEIWLAYMCGDEILKDTVSWTYPRWRGYPIIPFYSYRTTTEIKDKEYMIQGLVRSLKDPQREHNKRRTQELRHLNASANSGWLCEQGTWVNKKEVADYGSTPGVILEYKTGKPKPEKLQPTMISAGHDRLAEMANQDLKEISGVNSDLMAMSDKTTSGRAIMLRQKQGLVMLQQMLDNWTRTKRLLGKFLLSQLGEIYTVETAVKVLGQKYLETSFSTPQVDETGQPVLDQNGQLVMTLDKGRVGQIINTILNDSETGKYDVSIGEGSNTETVKFANSMLLMDLVEKGFPIPPEILIEESMLADGTKIRIKESIRQAQERAMQPGIQGGGIK